MVQPATEIVAISGGWFWLRQGVWNAVGRISEHGRSMSHWVRERTLPVRVLLYVALAAFAFFLAAGMGAMAALMWRGDADPSEAGGLRSAGEPNPERTQQQGAAVEKEETDVELKDVASGQYKTAARNADASKRDEAEYVGAVGDIQAEAVKSFLHSHEKLLRYDALSAGDVEEMEANAATLQRTKIRAANLVPPEKYEEQHEVFGAAIGKLHEAARLAHDMAADPIAAAELGFNAYDGHVSEASELLQRSNELLGKEYETTGSVREVSPEL